MEVAQERSRQREAERLKMDEREMLAFEVSLLQKFDREREQQAEEDKLGKRQALSKSAYVRRHSAMTAGTVALF